MTPKLNALLSAMQPERALFVREYLVDLNASAAAVRAGCSERTAYSQGQRLLKKVEVEGCNKAGDGRTIRAHGDHR